MKMVKEEESGKRVPGRGSEERLINLFQRITGV